jgi:hypothetical protein
MEYTMAISKKTARAKDLGFRSKGMTSCCMLKIAAASATGYGVEDLKFRKRSGLAI